MRHEVATRPVLYELPGMASVHVTYEEFSGADGEPLPMAVYHAIAPLSDPVPVVLLVEGYPDRGFQAHVGCRFMDMEWTISMARLMAASGLTAIAHSNRDPLPDALALLDHVSARTAKVGIWATSGHAPVALAAAAKATCAVMTTPVVKDVCPAIPLFLARAGRDETPGLNAALDTLVARAIADDRPVTLVNYPGAPHAFELSLDTSETRRILQQGIDFLKAHLH